MSSKPTIVTKTMLPKSFFSSQKYLRACKYMGVPPYANPNYKAELKAYGLWEERKVGSGAFKNKAGRKPAALHTVDVLRKMPGLRHYKCPKCQRYHVRQSAMWYEHHPRNVHRGF